MSYKFKENKIKGICEVDTCGVKARVRHNGLSKMFCYTHYNKIITELDSVSAFSDFTQEEKEIYYTINNRVLSFSEKLEALLKG